MRVAVVMPARDCERQVDATMASLLTQTRRPDVIVLADGCSRDATVARFLAHGGAGVPLRVVRNDSLFAGGGRNAAARAADCDLVVNMDFGNGADVGWLEAMTRPFEEDAALDYLGGVYLPQWRTPFGRVDAAVEYFVDTLAVGATAAELQAMLHGRAAPLPGGMCMAFRRSIWERAGGFAEWARKGQDRLFGHRLRHLQAKIGLSPRAIVHHHMADSLREVCDRRFAYSLWAARMALPHRRLHRILAVYGCGLLVLVGTLRQAALLPVLAVGLGAYLYRGAWRKLDRVAAVSGEPFSRRQRLQGIAVLLVRDAALLLGGLLGTLDRLLRPRWRRLTRAYVEEGR